MSFDLTNKNIKNTFQNLLQKTGSEGKLFDLVGNEVRDLTIDGTLTVNSFITSESIVNTSSGSTAFGNSSDDTHKFIGNITASGEISASGTLTANDILCPGTFNIVYNFYRRRLASDSFSNYYISEISSDRKEIRLDSNIIENGEIISSTNDFIEYRDASPYFVDFYLNFGKNQTIIANNINNQKLFSKKHHFQVDLGHQFWLKTL